MGGGGELRRWKVVFIGGADPSRHHGLASLSVSAYYLFLPRVYFAMTFGVKKVLWDALHNIPSSQNLTSHWQLEKNGSLN